MTLTLFFIFLMGIANFACHRAMLESRHPLIEEATAPLRSRLGQQATYVLEFLMLVTAMLIEASYPLITMTLYGLYTMFNILAYQWLLHQK